MSAGAVVRLSETGEVPAPPLTPEQRGALVRSGCVKVRAAADGGWLLSADGSVGVIRVGDLEVRIDPKVPIARLFFLLGYAKRIDWRPELVSVGARDRLLPAVAGVLARLSDRATAQGLLQGYRVVHETGPTLRGRIRAADQLARHLGRFPPLELECDQFGPDIPENQILRAAAARMRHLPAIAPAVSATLRQQDRKLRDVTVLTPGQRPPRWRPDARNGRYQPALAVAELVLRGTSVEFATGTVAVHGFLVQMPAVFESFLETSLREALRRHGGVLRGQDTAHHLDAARRVPLRPDLVWWVDDRPAAVIDAKYKAVGAAYGEDVRHADLYQMLAYCTALNLRRGHLVYANEPGDLPTHRVRHRDIDIHCHGLNLDQEPEPLLRDVAALAEKIAGGAERPR
ncbi:McrC family protein [Pilimelia columellifera]|uniref:McrBC 5-methylcytosine restriction system component n=1 Tax=Pilimelia columellifera subsp. columellifera TaxID=706583 RepID=A0ABN3NS46_9ACTN